MWPNLSRGILPGGSRFTLVLWWVKSDASLGSGKGKQLWQRFSRLHQMAFRECESIRGLLRTDINRPGTAAHMGCETGSRLYRTGGPDGYKHGRPVERTENGFEFERHFTEPADVRSDSAAAAATGKLDG